jgi:hypothetical protein
MSLKKEEKIFFSNHLKLKKEEIFPEQEEAVKKQLK